MLEFIFYTYFSHNQCNIYLIFTKYIVFLFTRFAFPNFICSCKIYYLLIVISLYQFNFFTSFDMEK